MLHKKCGQSYQKILCESTKWVRYTCQSVIAVLGMSMLASLLLGPIMIDCFVIYSCIALGGVFLFGGIMFLGSLFHLLLANYYSLIVTNGYMVKDIDAKRKVSFINLFFASMIVTLQTLATFILLIGGTGALVFGLTKAIGLLISLT